MDRPGQPSPVQNTQPGELMTHRGRLFWRALSAFLVLPGTVAFLLPWLLRPQGARLNIAGLPLLGAGVVLLLWCVRDFYVAGRGTLAPWAPPERLVIVGLYRLSRNPMYVAVVVILFGWALAFDARSLWIYTAAVAVMFHLRVVLAEEPWLARTHGEQWTAYRASVPRWLIATPGSFRRSRE
jgi:protein-S-isoprenylcysteine O-methyltransferase Ste14